MRLYDNPISGNSYKVRLMLALIGKEVETITIDSLHGGTRTPEFLAISPRGLIPVLDDGGEIIADSAAILTYLARKYAPQWLPESPVQQARVQEWLAIAADELQYGAAVARRIKKLGIEGDLGKAQSLARKGLEILESRLEQHTWLVCDTPTIADIACYPYVHLIPEGGLELTPYPAICKWLTNIQQLPGHVPMSVP